MLVIILYSQHFLHLTCFYLFLRSISSCFLFIVCWITSILLKQFFTAYFRGDLLEVNLLRCKLNKKCLLSPCWRCFCGPLAWSFAVKNYAVDLITPFLVLCPLSLTALKICLVFLFVSSRGLQRHSRCLGVGVFFFLLVFPRDFWIWILSHMLVEYSMTPSFPYFRYCG